MTHYRNPKPTVDVIIEIDGGIVLVERRNPPLGWAIPGGFVDEGEPLHQAAVREAAEETSLRVRLSEQFFSYSAPKRDPRQHTITTVFIAVAEGEPRGADDARQARVFPPDGLPRPLVFDHAQIIADYRLYRQTGARPPATR